MQIFIYILIGLCGGLLGGMGMGGGTLLIPFLTIFTQADQHIAQAINLIAFIPMSVVALIIHIKNKLVDFKCFLWIAIAAVAAGILSSWLTKIVNGKSLSRYFGIFLIVLGIYQLITLIVSYIKKRKSHKEQDITADEKI